MKVYLGSDHAGFQHKEAIKTFLGVKGYDVEDCGPATFDPQDDYTQYITPVAQKVNANPDNSKGIILGGTGQAEAMLANKFPNVRAALFYGPLAAKESLEIEGTVSEDPYAIIKLTRTHNDANVLSFGARFLTQEEVLHAVELWLTTEFSGVERHKRRIERMKEIASHI